MSDYNRNDKNAGTLRGAHVYLPLLILILTGVVWQIRQQALVDSKLSFVIDTVGGVRRDVDDHLRASNAHPGIQEHLRALDKDMSRK